MISVLQVSTFYSEHGGVEKSVSDLVSGLKDEHSVSVLCTQSAPGTSRRDIDGVSVTAVGGPIEIQGRPLAPTFPLELGRQRADVAHYHLPFPLAMASHLLLAPSARLTVATWHHDLVRHPKFSKLIQPLLECFLDRIDVILVTAPALIESTPVLYKRRQKCRVVPLGISDALFRAEPSSTSKLLAERLGQPLVLFVGRLVYYKGCEVLIKAMSQVDANLAMVGEGPLGASLKQLVQELGMQDRVHFLGRVSDEELVDLYNASSVFTLPSTLSTECFGLVQVEAMLAGKPVVNTNLPTGVPWVSLHGETGLTVPPGDVHALATALNRLLRDQKLLHQYGRQARMRAQEMFTLDRHVSGVAQLYREFLD